MVPGCRVVLFLIAVVSTAAPAQATCPDNADALGTERVLTVDPATYPRVGRKHFPQTLPLRAKEVVLTFDDGPEGRPTTRVLDTLKRECVRASSCSAAARPRIRRWCAESCRRVTPSRTTPSRIRCSIACRSRRRKQRS